MENTTVEGLTRDEWAASMAADGIDPQDAALAIAIAFGDEAGDCVDATDQPDEEQP